MGKLSDADAEKMIQNYRARAIQVIRELEEPGMRGTIRDAIEREVRVRLEVESHRKGKPKRKSKKATEAAVKAARAAAAAGAPGQVAAAMAAAAAKEAEDEEAKEGIAAHEAGEPVATDTPDEPEKSAEPAATETADEPEATAEPEPIAAEAAEPEAVKEAIR